MSLISAAVPGKPRVTLRLDNESRDFLRKLAAAKGWDISKTVREAISALQGNDALQALAQSATAPRSMPEDVLALTPRFLGCDGGDPRKEAARLFKVALAASYACQKLFPKSPGISERYKGLLDLFYSTEVK